MIFIGGESPGPEALGKIAREADILVAADSGLMACEGAGLRADWVIGDMDSLDDSGRLEKYPPERIRSYSPDKDHTDTELALAFLRKKSCDEIWIAGGGGGRVDHLFALFSLFEKKLPPDRWFPGFIEIRCLGEGKFLRATVPPGSTVSVFPLVAGPWAADSSGLKWPLNDLAWEKGGLGLSNTVLDGSFKIHTVRGRFLVTMPLYF